MYRSAQRGLLIARTVDVHHGSPHREDERRSDRAVGTFGRDPIHTPDGS